MWLESLPCEGDFLLISLYRRHDLVMVGYRIVHVQLLSYINSGLWPFWKSLLMILKFSYILKLVEHNPYIFGYLHLYANPF